MTNANGLMDDKGLELLTSGSPSGYKISIMMEELKDTYGKDYTIHPIDIFTEKKHKEKWFTNFGPNGRVPVLVDHDDGGVAIMEGAAILQYLSRHYDKDNNLSFPNDPEQAQCEAWISFGQSHVGPQTAECVFFNRFASEHLPYAIQYFIGEVERLYGVLDTHLADREYLVGGKYSIADIAVFAVVDVGPTAGIDRRKWRNLQEWWRRISSRPAVKTGSTTPFPNPFLGETY